MIAVFVRERLGENQSGFDAAFAFYQRSYQDHLNGWVPNRNVFWGPKSTFPGVQEQAGPGIAAVHSGGWGGQVFLFPLYRNGLNGRGTTDAFKGLVFLHETLHSILVGDGVVANNLDHFRAWARERGVENIAVGDTDSQTLNNFLGEFCQ